MDKHFVFCFAKNKYLAYKKSHSRDYAKIFQEHLPIYSNYKHHVTYKDLLGIAPSRAITFISELFDGSILNKEIVKCSRILNEHLRSENDSIMADREFTLENELAPLKVSLNLPSFLDGRL